MENIKMLEFILDRCVTERITPLIWGKHGIGKSMIVRDFFEKRGYEVIDLRLGQLEVGDLIGIPAQEFYCPVCEAKFGFSTKEAYCPICFANNSSKIPIAGRTVWLAPSWFPQNGEKRLLFFDELNRGRLDVQQATFQIVLDRRIHTHKIPDNCGIICACNPSGGDYYVEELDPALLDRFVNIKWNLSTRQWLSWARDNKIAPEIISFIQTDTKQLGNEHIKMEIPVSPSPRSYEFLSKILKGVPKQGNYWSEIATCIIGESAALAFVQSLKEDIEKPVKAVEIFKHWDRVKKRVKEQAVAKEDEGGRYDLLKATFEEVYDALKDGKSKKLSDEELLNVGRFLLEIPEDLAFSALKDLAPITDINDRLLMNPDIGTKLFVILKKARENDMK